MLDTDELLRARIHDYQPLGFERQGMSCASVGSCTDAILAANESLRVNQ